MSTRTVLVLSLSLFVSGCAKKPPVVARVEPPPPVVAETPPPPPAPPAPAIAPAPVPTEVAPLSAEEIFAAKSVAQLNAERPLADVYFDLDRAFLDDEARVALQRNAEWLQRWTSTQIVLEGHCDARGTTEYNLALGGHRGGAVKDYLVGLGVAASRILVVSKGKESPACVESSETCWQLNRRVQTVIVAK